MQVEVYDGTAAWLKGLELDDDALTKAIIGTIGDVDAYQLPDAKGHTALLRHMLKVSDAERQLRRDQILATTAQDFRCACAALECASWGLMQWPRVCHRGMRTPMFRACMPLQEYQTSHCMRHHCVSLKHRDFAKYVECVADAECARVVAVTSPERAAAAQEERPGFFDEVHNVL